MFGQIITGGCKYQGSHICPQLLFNAYNQIKYPRLNWRQNLARQWPTYMACSTHPTLTPLFSLSPSASSISMPLSGVNAYFPFPSSSNFMPFVPSPQVLTPMVTTAACCKPRCARKSNKRCRERYSRQFTSRRGASEIGLSQVCALHLQQLPSNNLGNHDLSCMGKLELKSGRSHGCIDETTI
ncbi:uncharacterized protein LOC109710038 isoform X2 [Ananas comosus]|uniref:Uncharacterized protein LOC109710038 isoform X2 n=1 Tax=Ananas comosus TaxID=4615 RepID=A0A6P5EW64_ANACO|nr:uncharacterized protein LOC109710038 isoform X2 [Ananas comosus]